MRRQPLYFLVCHSAAMDWALASVEQGLTDVKRIFCNDPHFLELMHVSVLTFSDFAFEVSPLTAIYGFEAPTLSASGGSSLGAGLSLLEERVRTDLRKGCVDQKDDYRPLVVLINHGESGDDYRSVAAEIRQSTKYDYIIAIDLATVASRADLRWLTHHVVTLEQVGTIDMFFTRLCSVYRENFSGRFNTLSLDASLRREEHFRESLVSLFSHSV
jgi:uncharacterized protein YegL